MNEPVRTYDDYTVGWICALEVELAAAIAMLDEEHRKLPSIAGDENVYHFGAINGHNIVIGSLADGETGNNPASAVAARMKLHFKSLSFSFLVGIGGGVPCFPSRDIRLGDIAVSSATSNHGGVVQYDRGRTLPGHFELVGLLNRPPEKLRQAVLHLRAGLRLDRSRLVDYLSALVLKHNDFASPAVSGQRDLLFNAAYEHQNDTHDVNCKLCDPTQRVSRPPRHSNPVVHYGLIASGNQVMRSGLERDRTSVDLGGVLCFEMEAAGLMNHFPCLVIRGICDYSDSHKNKIWQPYAAAAAAAYTKDLLNYLEPVIREQTQPKNSVFEEKPFSNPELVRLDRRENSSFASAQKVLHDSGIISTDNTRTVDSVMDELKLEESWQASQARLHDFPRLVQAVAFSQNGNILASAAYDKTIRLWDTTSGTLEYTLSNQLEMVSALVFSSNGQVLASIAKNEVRLWDIQKMVLLKILKVNSNTSKSTSNKQLTKITRAIAFSPDGQDIAFTSAENTIHIKNAKTGDLQQTIKSRSKWVYDVKFSSNGQILAIADKDTVQCWDVKTGKLQESFKVNSDVVNTIAFLPNEQVHALASAISANTVQIWDFQTGLLRATLIGHTRRVEAIAFSPDGRELATVSLDNTVQLWDTGTGARLQYLDFCSKEADNHVGHPRAKKVGAVSILPDGQILAFTSEYHAIQRWERIATR